MLRQKLLDLMSVGKLLVRKALAEGQNLKRAAMIGVEGDLIVALEAAKNFNLSYLEFTTQRVDLLEIEQMVQKFGVAPLEGEGVVEV